MFNGSCENCGIDIIHKKALKLGGTYWITTSGKWFCSNRCKTQFIAHNNTNNPVIDESVKVENFVKKDYSNNNDAELQRERIEREQAEEAKRMVKGQKLRNKGRPFAAWLTELNPVYSTGIIIGILVSYPLGGVYPIIGSITLIVIAFLLIREAIKKNN